MHTAFFAVILCYLCSGITSSRLSRRRHVTTNQVEEPARRAKEDQSAIVRVFSSRRKHRWLSLRPSISVKRQRIHMITETPTNSIRCKIFCRSGYHLEILPSGVVKGTIDQESKYVHFEMQSFGASLVKLRNTATGRYLTMKKNGTLRGQWNGKTLESLFKEFHEENAFLSYASHRYFKREPHDMLVGLKKSGLVKRATKTRPGQTATQFVVIKL